MKLVPKMQRGASFTPYYAEYRPIEGPGSLFGDSRPSARSTGGEKQSSEKGELTKKDYYEMLKGIDGLPNEMMDIFHKTQGMFLSPDPQGISASRLANLYTSTLTEMRIAKFNKQRYEGILSQVNENEGMNEYAVTESGNVVVYNKDQELKEISVSEYMKNPDQYRALTNSNILKLRAYDRQYTYKDGDRLFDIAANAIGINKVEKMLRDRLQNLGTTEQQYQGYTSKQGDTIKQGVKVLEEIASKNQSDGTNLTIDGLYKDKVITKEQKNQAEAAIKYIYETLPTNAKAVLQLHSGDPNNPTAGAFKVISDLVTQGMSSTRSVIREYESSLNADGTKRKDPNSSSSDDGKLNIAQQWLIGAGAKESFTINPGTNLATKITATGMPIVSKEGEVYEIGSSLRELTNSQYGGSLNFNKAVMGDRRIKSGHLDEVLLTDNTIRLVDFPINPDGTPDLSPRTLESVEKYRNLAREAGIDIDDQESVRRNSQKLNAILQECGLPVAYDSNGNYITGRWAQFGVMQGIATSSALESNGNKNYNLFREVNDRADIDSYKRIMEKKLDAKLDFDYDDWGIFEGDYTHMLEGTIWIPVNNNIFNAGAGSGEKLSPDTFNQRFTQQVATDRYMKQQELLSRYNNLKL